MEADPARHGSPGAAPPAETGGRLRRRIGLTAFTFYGLGVILGAGIYAIIGEAAGAVGGGLWLSFTLAGLVAACTGLSYAELGAMFPLAGAEYHYTRHAFGRNVIPYLVGWLLVASGAAAVGTVAVAFGGYLRQWLPLPATALAAGLIVLATAVNLAGIRQSAAVNIALTLVEAAGLVLVVALGVPHLGDADYLEFRDGLSGLAAAAALTFFAYLGFEEMANVSEETIDPDRTVPVGILLATGIAVVLYALVALAAVSLARPDVLAASDSPLALAAERGWGAASGRLLALFGIAATANTALLLLVAKSRLILGLARDRELPAPLAAISRRTGVPWVAALLAGGLSLAFLPIGGLGVIGSVSSWAALVAFAAVNAALLTLRFTSPDRPRPFRAPLNVGRLSLTGGVGLLTTIALATQFNPRVLLLGLVILALGAALAPVLRRRRPAG